MNTQEYIESGNLELYVYGLLDESETKKISELSKNNPEIKKEIVSIEKAILNLSSSFSPAISAENFEKIKAKLEMKHGKVVDLQPKSNWSQYLGWAASIVLLIGIGYQYNKQQIIKNEIVTIQKEKEKLNEAVVATENKNNQTKKALDVIRDSKNTVIALAGQAVSPTSSAKVYWNKETQVVYIDASGLPKPPKGMVYQVWSLKLSPTLMPTSIGLLEDFSGENNLVFEVSSTVDAEAFGITLEPAGGSQSPTMEQLYTLGKV
ncbi:MAG: anti-sigma factor [Flavobacterium sp.]|uniref:anti-sigma factor n=1 Tax=Flavobacterium sp. TaxID=239 RepID=UPI0022C328AB|nr:anti-sigma factor [Flavobacterium sp.]MCZ8198478.1 anti-sigma factor [Flavobacterium sp.]